MTVGRRLAILILMSMTKRVQVPVEDADYELFRSAARKEGVPLAEWARELMRARAGEVLRPESLTPDEALAVICSLEAPVANVETMIAESTEGRYE